MIVASWPGYLKTQNDFLRIFLDGLASAGCDVVSINSIDSLRTSPSADVLLLHWPQRAFWEASSRIGALKNMLVLLNSLRTMRPETKVVWLVHDLEPHDATGMQRWLWKPYIWLLCRLLDGILTLSQATSDVVRDSLPVSSAVPFHSVWHPKYPGEVATDDERRAVRAALGVGETVRVVGYCGQLRHNKGIDLLVDAFRQLDDPELCLLVAGQVTRGASHLDELLSSAAAEDRRILYLPGELTAEQFRRTISGCDLVAAPFRKYLHSGSIIHALSADRPVATPRTPFVSDLENQLGGGWVRVYEGSLDGDTLKWLVSVPFPVGPCPLDEFDPNSVGRSAHRWLVEIGT